MRKKYSESYTYEMRDRYNKVVPDCYMMFDNFNYQCRLVKAFDTPEAAEKCYQAIPENCKKIVELRDDMIIIDSSDGQIGAYFTKDKEIAISFLHSEDCKKVRELLELNVFERYVDNHAQQHAQTIYFHPKTFPQYLVDKVIMDIANVYQKERNPNAMLWAALKILENDQESLEKKMQVLHVVRLNMEGYFDQQLARMIESKIGQYERTYVEKIYLAQERNHNIIEELKYKTGFKPDDNEINRQLTQASNSRFAQQRSSEFPTRFENRANTRFAGPGAPPVVSLVTNNPLPPVVTIVSAPHIPVVMSQVHQPAVSQLNTVVPAPSPLDDDWGFEDLNKEIYSNASSSVSSFGMFPQNENEKKSKGIIEDVIKIMIYYTTNKLGSGKGITRCNSLVILLEAPQLNINWKIIAVCAMLNSQISSSTRGEKLAGLLIKQLNEPTKRYLFQTALKVAKESLGIEYDSQLINTQNMILTRAGEGFYKSRDTLNDENVLPKFNMDAEPSFLSRIFK